MLSKGNDFSILGEYVGAMSLQQPVCVRDEPRVEVAAEHESGQCLSSGKSFVCLPEQA